MLGIGGGEQRKNQPYKCPASTQKCFRWEITNSSFLFPLTKYASCPLFFVIRWNWNLHWGRRTPILKITVDFSLKNKAETHWLTPTGFIIWFSILQNKLLLSFSSSSSPQWTLIPEYMVFNTELYKYPVKPRTNYSYILHTKFFICSIMKPLSALHSRYITFCFARDECLRCQMQRSPRLYSWTTDSMQKRTQWDTFSQIAIFVHSGCQKSAAK